MSIEDEIKEIKEKIKTCVEEDIEAYEEMLLQLEIKLFEAEFNKNGENLK